MEKCCSNGIAAFGTVGSVTNLQTCAAEVSQYALQCVVCIMQSGVVLYSERVFVFLTCFALCLGSHQFCQMFLLCAEIGYDMATRSIRPHAKTDAKQYYVIYPISLENKLGDHIMNYIQHANASAGKANCAINDVVLPRCFGLRPKCKQLWCLFASMSALQCCVIPTCP